MPVGNPRDCRSLPRWKNPLAALLVAALLAVAACAPVYPTPPAFKSPSKVISEAGMEYFVYELKFPGTSQEFKMRVGNSLIWLPLASVRYVRFSGPEQDNYRPAEVVLTTGEKVRGELFVGQLIQGNTDVGYWNISLKDVRNLAMGDD